ncbi:hypothetical protein AAEO56_17015 [Flavobacterium sp. DGU11]|uniref:Lipoprotein n=1 Tax=Flavobacterium arundinis TaxID=3139143 RepID=A0ABU9I2E0_9FLAO
MKKLLVLLAVIGIAVACTDEPDTLKFHVAFVPVISVEMPEEMIFGQTYEIKVKYKRPNDCHYFDGFYHDPNNTSAEIIAVQTLVIEDAQCAPLDGLEPDESSFDFTCSSTYAGTSYLFKFYKGDDAQGNQQFLEIEVPVHQ